ncbi:MAG: hypothetical protein JXA11_06720 [Phycisphaerae bacterium]|nr:hypothetical protein [Phycisphaerae bacterium]
MAALIWLIMIAIVFLGIGIPVYVFINERRWYLKFILSVVLIGALPLTYFMTAKYKAVWNENTYAIGWPIPVVVFQRPSPEDSYSDFVGPTIILAYPFNYALYTVFPDLIIMVFTMVRKRSLTKSKNQPQ